MYSCDLLTQIAIAIVVSLSHISLIRSSYIQPSAQIHSVSPSISETREISEEMRKPNHLIIFISLFTGHTQPVVF